jgi:hypothetical protein
MDALIPAVPLTVYDLELDIMYMHGMAHVGIVVIKFPHLCGIEFDLLIIGHTHHLKYAVIQGHPASAHLQADLPGVILVYCI